jgi:hypothetical protein
MNAIAVLMSFQMGVGFEKLSTVFGFLGVICNYGNYNT